MGFRAMVRRPGAMQKSLGTKCAEAHVQEAGSGQDCAVHPTWAVWVVGVLAVTAKVLDDFSIVGQFAQPSERNFRAELGHIAHSILDASLQSL